MPNVISALTLVVSGSGMYQTTKLREELSLNNKRLIPTSLFDHVEARARDIPCAVGFMG